MISKMRFSMSANIIGAIVLLLVIFGLIVSTLGAVSFSNTLKKEYAVSTYHMADTATALINGNHLDEYLAGEEQEEYRTTRAALDAYCHKMSVSLIYVIVVDTVDYGRFVSVFNQVDNSVDNSSYTEWELGHRRDTTNDEYRQKYKALYDKASPYETVYRLKTTDGQHPHITTMVPVKDSKGEVAAILCVQRPAREVRDTSRPYLITIAVSTVLLALVSSFAAAYYIRKNVVSPVRMVSVEATRFARENTIGEPLGTISQYKEIASLADSVETMERDMVSYMENLTAITAEKERIGVEMKLASTIQENSIPNSFPAFPERDDFDIYGSMTPAKEVGGDFYNFLLIDDDHLAVVIGDVSGKGVPGALFMMVTNILVSNRTQMGGTPAEVLGFVNDNICEHSKADMFVTLWLGVLELSTGKIIAANAGHDDAAVCRRDGSFELFRTKHALAVGAVPGIRYTNFEICLEEGDKLFLYTDGVPEATNREEQMFTIDRMIEALNRKKEKSPKEILEGVHASVNAFAGDAPQFDDLTMLCVELKKKRPRRTESA